MTTPRRRAALCVSAALAALLLVQPVPVTTSQTATDKTLFVTVVDADGKPVTDLRAGEFAVREDNLMREVTAVTRATRPLHISLLVDTTTPTEEFVRDIRVSLGAFVKAVAASNPDSQIALMEFGQAAITIVNFTSRFPDLERSIARLFPKPNASSVLLEAIVDASRSLARRPSPRRAIVVFNLEPGNEQSRQQPNLIAESFQNSEASLWAVSLQKGELRNPARDVVLNALAQNSGGRREFILNPAALESTFVQIAGYLASQYEITYRRPATTPEARMTQVGVARPGLKVHARLWAPK